MYSIDVCVPTFRRPDMLKRLLAALASQSLTDAACLRIIVIDNDEEKSAEAVAIQAARNHNIDLVYEAEPQPGISYARNRALEISTSELIAFVDDDEIVPQNWLDALVETLLGTGADVVFGPVLGIVPPDAPQWAKEHPRNIRAKRKTGDDVVVGATGNVLMRRSALGAPELRFREDFALSGGEDLEFFTRMKGLGARFVWCEEAIAYEHLPTDRLTISWIRQRAYRSGQSYARVVLANTDGNRFPRILRKTIILAAAIIALLPARALSRSSYARISMYLCRSWGELTILLKVGRIYNEYER